ncbi:hypothetical protein ACFVUW_15785 [Streptomyces xiamenensis]|uniref:hypothetical protein n=1 Tax=Streptomyces xiamenensis TaxID=408015 RepID=UPI0036E7C6DC
MIPPSPTPAPQLRQARWWHPGTCTDCCRQALVTWAGPPEHGGPYVPKLLCADCLTGGRPRRVLYVLGTAGLLLTAAASVAAAVNVWRSL